jgi:hypothetical protein
VHDFVNQPRRSIQGAYIGRDAKSGIDLPARMRPETLGRIGPLAKYLLAVQRALAADGGPRDNVPPHLKRRR